MFKVIGRLILEGHHMVYHLIVGFFVGWGMAKYSTGLELPTALIVSLPASWLPDLEHILFLFGYGKDSSYGKAFHKVWSGGDFWEVLQFCAKNHKRNNGLYSHHLLVALATLTSGIVAAPSHPLLATLLLSFAGHYWFDIMEDLVLLGKVTPGWLRGVRFSQKQSAMIAPKKLRHTRSFKKMTDSLLFRLPLPNVNPSFLSLFSLINAVLFLWFFPLADRGSLLCFLGLSIFFDVFDGAIARKHNRVTGEGYYIDVLSDRLSEGLLILPFLNSVWGPWFIGAFAVNLVATLISIATKHHYVPFGKTVLLLFLLWQWVI